MCLFTSVNQTKPADVWCPAMPPEHMRAVVHCVSRVFAVYVFHLSTAFNSDDKNFDAGDWSRTICAALAPFVHRHCSNQHDPAGCCQKSIPAHITSVSSAAMFLPSFLDLPS